MNRDDQFEKHLSRQPLKPVSPAWRAEILSAAEHAADSAHASRNAHHGWLATLTAELSAAFWPHPRAWAALGAAWVLILIANVLAHDDSAASLARRDPASTPRMEGVLQQKEQMFSERVGFVESQDADRLKTFVPRPRSQRSNDFMEA